MQSGTIRTCECPRTPDGLRGLPKSVYKCFINLLPLHFDVLV